jgi:hypothetical protein
MNLVELDHALRKLRLSGMADVLEARLRQAQSEKQTPIDLVSALVGDELVRRQDRLIARVRRPDASGLPRCFVRWHVRVLSGLSARGGSLASSRSRRGRASSRRR